jgi:hypothetical protein
MLPTLCMGCYLCRPSVGNVNLGFVTGVAVEQSHAQSLIWSTSSKSSSITSLE